jgi:hypothetical protein
VMSSSLTARVNFIASGLKIRDGASPVAPVPAATGPACPSCAEDLRWRSSCDHPTAMPSVGAPAHGTR